MDEVLHRLSTLFQALGNGVRLKLLETLRGDAKSVSELGNVVDRPVNAVSRHLRILRDNNLVESETQGKNRIYSLKRPTLVQACLGIKTFLKRSDK